MGAYKYGTDRGRVYVYYGDGMDTKPDIVLTGEQDYNYFGDLTTCGGDVNGDKSNYGRNARWFRKALPP